MVVKLAAKRLAQHMIVPVHVKTRRMRGYQFIIGYTIKAKCSRVSGNFLRCDLGILLEQYIIPVHRVPINGKSVLAFFCVLYSGS